MSGEVWFEWNGVKSTEYGVYVDTQPPITRPIERVSYTSIPGRSGALTQTEGEDVYEDLILTVQCVMKDGTRIPEIMKWLKGAGKVAFANRKGGFYYARVNNLIPFDKILRGRENRSFPIVFRCKPFWYADAKEETVLTAPGTIMNDGSVYAEPVTTVQGEGDVVLLVGETIIELTGLDGEVTIDSELQECYSGDKNMNSMMGGEFPRLQPGLNGISWTGGVTRVTVRVNERYL